MAWRSARSEVSSSPTRISICCASSPLMEVSRRAATILALRIVWRSKLMVTFCFIALLPPSIENTYRTCSTCNMYTTYDTYGQEKEPRFAGSLSKQYLRGGLTGFARRGDDGG